MNKIITKDPTTLAIHPLAEMAPNWSVTDDRFKALDRDIEERGQENPVIICQRNGVDLVCDGRKRVAIAVRRQRTEINCLVVAEEQVPRLLVRNLMLRDHFTKSARAYLAYPLLEIHWKSKIDANRENLQKGQQIPEVGSSDFGKTVEEMAAHFGIERSLMFYARKVHQLFEKDAEFKAQMEPRILAESFGGEHEKFRPVGLGAVIAGYAGRDTTKGRAKNDRGQLDLFERGIGAMDVRWTYWKDFDAEEKAKAREAIRETVFRMPADLRAEWVRAIKDAEKAKAATAATH
jgi:hypothetical protein